MFTQFFGSYLLNRQLVTSEQLARAMSKQHDMRTKLGVLAINSGYMTASQVDDVHDTQAREDKRFGDIAKEKNYLNETQIEELLGKQRTGHLLLGQALIDDKVMNYETFENCLNSYNRENAITDFDFASGSSNRIHAVLKKFFCFQDYKNGDMYTEYVSLFFKNIIRFIGDDFMPMNSSIIQKCDVKYLVSQNITGEFNAYSAIDCDDKTSIVFASRFAEKEYIENDEQTKSAIGEFLTLQNGLFAVNMSNTSEINLELTPPDFAENRNIDFYQDAFSIPVEFSFGIIHFIFSPVQPNIK